MSGSAPFQSVRKSRYAARLSARAGELSLTREGGRRSLLRKDGVEIGNPC